MVATTSVPNHHPILERPRGAALPFGMCCGYRLANAEVTAVHGGIKCKELEGKRKRSMSEEKTVGIRISVWVHG